AGARARSFSPQRLAQPRARAHVGIHALDADDPEGAGPADVPADARRARARHAGVAQIAMAAASGIAAMRGTRPSIRGTFPCTGRSAEMIAQAPRSRSIACP